ncbi:hypothetical protein E2C01_037817 [Portunus trituberculatus]|uniref:Uncharacterized protein n=1 Tax=Portunus trituberculatus TaxID=210409 RepID=A0A5B7FGB4_PORTR|nr:hypothetical protein [Portunus trituberculatus]
MPNGQAKVWWPRTWTSTCAVTAYEGPGAGESPATTSHRHQLCWGPPYTSRPPAMTADLVGHKTSPAIVRPVEGHNRAAPLLSAQDKLQ